MAHAGVSQSELWSGWEILMIKIGFSVFTNDIHYKDDFCMKYGNRLSMETNWGHMNIVHATVESLNYALLTFPKVE